MRTCFPAVRLLPREQPRMPLPLREGSYMHCST